MKELHVGDPVIVFDPFLLRLNQMSGRIHNKGWVNEICEDGEIMVEFPIGNDNPDEHSQVSPYPKSQVIFDNGGIKRN